MSLYISNDNQTLLWNLINKNKLIYDFFTTNPHIVKNDWFKSIVQLFYDQNRNRSLNSRDLLELNKATIGYMLNSIKPRVEKYVDNTVSVVSEKINDRFLEKQNEYNSLLEKKVPDTIDFGEKKDGPIPNMDYLIEKHLKEREEELKKYAPQILPSTNIESNRLKIDTSSDVINISIEEIKEETRNKKSVTWLDDENQKKLEKDIDALKQQVNELTEKVKYLEENRK